jgi:hypothetical protein
MQFMLINFALQRKLFYEVPANEVNLMGLFVNDGFSEWVCNSKSEGKFDEVYIAIVP